MLRCNCSSPGRSAAREQRPANGEVRATRMDAPRQPRRVAPSGVMHQQRPEHSLRHRVRRNCRGPLPRRGISPPMVLRTRSLPTRNCRAVTSSSHDRRTTLNARAPRAASHRRSSRVGRGSCRGQAVRPLSRRYPTRVFANHERTVARAAVLLSKTCLTCMVIRLPSPTTLITSICRGWPSSAPSS